MSVAFAAFMVLAAGEPGRALAQESTASTDRAALVALYNATDGPNWENCYYSCRPTTNWLSDKPIGEWSGVTTNADGRVRSLNLPGYRMKGPLPAELGNLSELGYLDLSNNPLIGGSIPPELGKLTKLWYFNLINAGLSGSIPPELGSLTGLFSLKLQTNGLTGSIPSELGNLTSLSNLRLGKNKLTGSIPPELGNLTGLRRLELHQNQLTGSIPPELGNLSQLDELDFSRNRLSGSIPSELGNLSVLQKLRLDNNQLSGSIPSELGNLSMLQRLRLNNNQLGGSIPAELSKLLKLIELDLSWNQLSGSVPTEVQNLPTLQTLNLNVNRLNGLLDQAPVVSSEIADISDLQPEEIRTISLEGVFSDVDGHIFWVSASSSDNRVALSYAAVNFLYSRWPLYVEGVQAGTATITVTARDYNGYEVSDSFDVTVALPPNNAPTVGSAIADIGSLPIGTSQEVNLTSVFSDADSDTLTLSAASSATAVATVSVAADGSKLTVTGVAAGTATITVTAQDSDGNSVSDAFDVTVPAANQAPAVSAGISDATIVNTSGTKRVSLSGVFTDADADSLTIEAKSSATGIATVSVAADYSSLTVTAKSRGTAMITVTASDGTAEVSDTFTVTVKAAPAVSSAIADISELAAEASQEISLSGVFTDADSDSLTLSAVSSDNAVVTVVAQLDPVTASARAITVTGVAEGTATITVTARDSDGNSVSDTFDVTVPAAESPQELSTVPGEVIDLTLTVNGDKVVVRWTAPELGSAPKGYIVHLKPEGGETGSGKTKRPKAKKTKVTYNKLEAGTTYNVWVRAQNEAGKGERVYETISLAAPQPTATAKAKAKVNSAPTVASEIPDLSGLRVDNTRNVSLASVFTDADGDALTISASSSNDGVATATVNGQSLTVSARQAGTATITVTAADGKGGSVSDAFNVTVSPKPNRAPTVASALGDLSGLREGDSRQVSLAGVFTDADGDTLTITVSSLNNGVATATVNGQSLTVSAKQTGTATITVTAADTRGSSTTDAFTVTVEASPAPQPEPEPEQEATQEPEPEQEQQQESGSASESDLPSIVQQYDKDGSGKIESGEWALAIADYSAQKLTTPQIQVIAGYRG